MEGGACTPCLLEILEILERQGTVGSGVGEEWGCAQWIGCQQDAVMKRINHAGHAGRTQ